MNDRRIYRKVERKNPATRIGGVVIFHGGHTRKLTWRERFAIRVCQWAGGKYAAPREI